MIKIDSNRPVQKATPKKSTSAGGGSGSDFSANVGTASDVSETAAVVSVQATPSLLGLQEVDERTTARRHGDELLSYLDEIRLDLLSGELDSLSLKNVAARVKAASHHYSDPKMSQMIQEIELRVNIELAKRGLL